jgi:hypothetical protein
MAIVALAALSGCKKGLEEKTLTFNERDTNNFGFVDAAPKTKFGKQGPAALSPGDVVAFSADMIDSSKKDVGDLDAHCVTTRPGRFETAHAACQGAATLPQGQLFLQVGGKAFGSDTTTGAVSGGTGDYAGATGTFTSVGQDNSKDTFKLFIPK